MQFDSFSAFLDMGGYGFYVWLSFGVSAALLLALLINSLMGHKQTIKKIALRQQRENKLRQLRTKRNENTTNTHNEVTE
jgi:heme exporter protein D